MRELITLLEASSKPTDIELVELSYPKTALNPVITVANITQHLKLAQGYCDRYNKKEGDAAFNYAGYILHNIWFSQFRAPRNNNTPNGPIGNLIKSKFGDWEKFKEEFAKTAMGIQGSGWCYLSREGTIKTIQNHSVRRDILLLVDMWEHSFQPDYGPNKKKYLDNIWKIIDWNRINTVWAQPYKS
jgi:Fe-Mn family superoxide dismutase